MNTVWDLTKIYRVQHVYCTIEIDNKSLVAARKVAGLEEKYRKALADELVATIKANLDADISMFDVGFAVVHNSERDSRTLTGRWLPSTTNLVLRGGAEDGRIMAVEKVGDRITVPVVRAASQVMLADLHASTDNYELAGWNSAERHWIYDLQPKEGYGTSQQDL